MSRREPVAVACATAVVLAGWLGAPAAGAAPLEVPCANGGQTLVKDLETAASEHATATLSLQAGCTYALEAANNYWYGPNGLPPIASPVTIEGHGARIVRVQSAPAFRFFFVGAGEASGYVSPGPGSLTLRQVVLKGGLAQGGDSDMGGGGAGMGGAIFDQGTTIVEDSTIVENEARGGASLDAKAGNGGGGIGEGAPLAGNPEAGGGFGGGKPFEAPAGGTGGVADLEAAGGGAGFLNEESGQTAKGSKGGGGGGLPTGLGGAGSGNGSEGGPGGDGSGGGSGSTTKAGAGGAFGDGGLPSGGGGGIGGGGAGNGEGLSAGGGGFGAGGGAQLSAEPSGAAGGAGGFGGGGGGGHESGGHAGFGGGEGAKEAGGGGAGMGGAIFDMQGSVSVIDSTVTANSALGGSGGEGAAAGEGIAGAVFNLNGGFAADASTFAANRASGRASQIYDIGYDAQSARTALALLRDTIVSGSPEAGAEVVAAKIANGPEIVGEDQASAETDLSHFDLVQVSLARGGGVLRAEGLTSADPLLGELRDNGGPTPTMALEPGSPAIDAGGETAPYDTDQRGLPRGVAFAGLTKPPGGDGSDIGAYEVQPLCVGATLPFTQCPAQPEARTEQPLPAPKTEASSPTPTLKSPGTLSAIAKQKLGSTVKVAFLCTVSSCVVTLTATVTYGRKHLSLQLKAVTIRENGKPRLAIKLTNKDRNLLSNALAKRQKVTVAVYAVVAYEGHRAKAGPLAIKLTR